MTDLWQRLKQRKLVQWALAYVAFAFALIQVADVIAGSYGWPHGVMHLLFGLLVLGFVVTLLLAWYHGEQGRQRASGTELLLIALVLAVGGGLLWRFARVDPSHPDRADTETSATHAASATARVGNGAASASSSTAIPAKSVAVLPFQNLSGDTKEKYFSDGITEEILNALAQIPDLKVAGRTSAFQFSSREENLRHIGETLGVADVLVGSVQKAGDEVRINVQLVDTNSGYQRWSEKYDRKLTNIFAVEDDISSAIAGTLRVQLTGGGGQPLVAQGTIDPRAHDFYLRGLTLLAARGPGLRDAVAAFQNAVKVAPKYADAWGALAEAQALYPDYDLATMQAADPSALTNARHALSLDPDLASAYVAQGMVYKEQWQWPQADQAFRRAVSLAPGDAEAVNQQAQFQLAAGQFKPALTEVERAQRLDPLSPSIGATRAYLLMILGQYDAASAQLQSILAAHPDYVNARYNALQLALIRLNYTDAERQARLLAALVGRDPDPLESWVRGIADPTLRAGAVQSLETSPGAAHLRGGLFDYAHWLTLLGEQDRALAVLERLPVQRNSPEPDDIWGPAFDPIRNDPRFKAVLKKMGLPYTPAGIASHD
jgi:TolB-like protein